MEKILHGKAFLHWQATDTMRPLMVHVMCA
jgi:hypothetical protein